MEVVLGTSMNIVDAMGEISLYGQNKASYNGKGMLSVVKLI
jgi:hypothetical protein